MSPEKLEVMQLYETDFGLVTIDKYGAPTFHNCRPDHLEMARLFWGKQVERWLSRQCADAAPPRRSWWRRLLRLQ